MVRPLCVAALLAAVFVACGDDGSGPEGGPPTLLSLSPSVGTVGTEIRITGSNFQAGLSVFVGDQASTSVDLVDGEVFALVPTGLDADATYDVRVRNPGGGQASLSQAFSTVAPELDFANGATLPSGNAGSTIVIEGDHFGDVQGSANVFFSDGTGGVVAADVPATADWTNQFILATVPSGAASGPMYVETATGVSDNLQFTLTQNATFSPSTINWTATEALPQAVSGHAASLVRFLAPDSSVIYRAYSVGGSPGDSVPVTTGHVSDVESGGALAGWSEAGALSEGRSHHALVAATPFNSKVPGSGRLFVIGGISEKDGQPESSVLSIALDADGNLGAETSATSLPEPLHSAEAVLFRSSIYVVGGATTDDAPVTSVYRAQIDTLGALGVWETLDPLPSARAHHGLTIFGATLYAVGGEGTAVDPEDGSLSGGSRIDEVLTGRLDLRSGDLAAGWTVSNSTLNKARSKHGALAMGGTLFVTSGLYSAANTGSSENSAAPINTDGSVGSFGGATGSNTLLSESGVNRFNHAAITYVDASGVAHVMVIGGDAVNNPGNKSAGVLFY